MTTFWCLPILVFAALCFLRSEPCTGEIPMSGEVNIAYDFFRGMSDGSWSGNVGVVAGANFGALLYRTLGVQAGGSYGVYDWYGHAGIIRHHTRRVEQQVFLTSGTFVKAPRPGLLQYGLVLDWMFTSNFGLFSRDPSLGQLRMQMGYLWNSCHEFGAWGTVNANTDHRKFHDISLRFRAVSQLNLFWRYLFGECAEAMVWAGIPYKSSLMCHKKRQGQYIVGGSFRFPVTERLSLEAHGSYMGPNRRGHASQRFKNYAANIAIGITYALGGADDSIWCSEAQPFLPVANNSTFLVDTNLNN